MIIASHEPLTRREQQIADGIMAGRSNKQIAIDLGISPRTVEDHRANIFRKAGVNSAAALVHMLISAENQLLKARIAELEARA